MIYFVIINVSIFVIWFRVHLRIFKTYCLITVLLLPLGFQVLVQQIHYLLRRILLDEFIRTLSLQFIYHTSTLILPYLHLRNIHQYFLIICISHPIIPYFVNILLNKVLLYHCILYNLLCPSHILFLLSSHLLLLNHLLYYLITLLNSYYLLFFHKYYLLNIYLFLHLFY